ncbi:MAG: hypothetical protein JWQ35_933 [Bacteriovoracaceae bacterium]|nr:hypothetical protein [Bacteriovoracaceae bacterium]
MRWLTIILLLISARTCLFAQDSDQKLLPQELSNYFMERLLEDAEMMDAGGLKILFETKPEGIFLTGHIYDKIMFIYRNPSYKKLYHRRKWDNRDELDRNRELLKSVLASKEYEALPGQIDFHIRYGKSGTTESKALFETLKQYVQFLRQGAIYHSYFDAKYYMSSIGRKFSFLVSALISLGALTAYYKDFDLLPHPIPIAVFTGGTFLGRYLAGLLVGPFRQRSDFLVHSDDTNYEADKVRAKYDAAITKLNTIFEERGYETKDPLATFLLLRDKLNPAEAHESTTFGPSLSSVPRLINRRDYLVNTIDLIRLEIRENTPRPEDLQVGSPNSIENIKKTKLLQDFQEELNALKTRLEDLKIENKKPETYEIFVGDLAFSITEIQGELEKLAKENGVLEIDPAVFLSADHEAIAYNRFLNTTPGIRSSRSSSMDLPLDSWSKDIYEIMVNNEGHLPGASAIVQKTIDGLNNQTSAKNVPISIRTTWETMTGGPDGKEIGLKVFTIDFFNSALGSLLKLNGAIKTTEVNTISAQTLISNLQVCDNALQKLAQFQP